MVFTEVVVHPLLELFVFGTLWFWVLLAVIATVITVFSEEDGVKATVTLILGALFLQFVAKYDLIGLIRGEPLRLAVYAFAYIMVGFNFACVKWWRYAKSKRRQYDSLRASFFKKNNLEGDALPPASKNSFLVYLQEHYSPNRHGGFNHYSDPGGDPVIPDITKNKAAFIRWMTYWPLNALFTLLNDPVRRLFEWLYEVAGERMQAIANHVFSGTERDRLSKEESLALDSLEREQRKHRGY